MVVYLIVRWRYNCFSLGVLVCVCFVVYFVYVLFWVYYLLLFVCLMHFGCLGVCFKMLRLIVLTLSLVCKLDVFCA